jgi:hypothetical protein
MSEIALSPADQQRLYAEPQCKSKGTLHANKMLTYLLHWVNEQHNPIEAITLQENALYRRQTRLKHADASSLVV